LDRDSSRRKNSVEEVYRTFHGEKADILIGTQMVVQGFDFPRVTLVGVLDADTALFHPDFRSSERTFQWILQAVGRAGRSDLGGDAVIQTTLPEHHAIQSALANDYEAFYRLELGFRQKNFYPPFARLLLLRVESAESQSSVEIWSKKLCTALEERLEANTKNHATSPRTEILGPGPCPREKLEKKWRWQILIKTDPSAALTDYVGIARQMVFPPTIKLIIDVDPYNIL
jgi:primosomal protein N' (replication factor Y)